MNNSIPAAHRPFLERLVKVLGVTLAVIVIFWAGMAVGRRQSGFGDRFGGHFREAYSSNGAAGKIVGLNYPSIVIEGRDDVEKVVLIGSTTQMRAGRSVASTSDMRLGDVLIAIGEPDDQGRIKATFVRILR